MVTKTIFKHLPQFGSKSRPKVTYAIGDIHGELLKLQALYAKILRHRETHFEDSHLRLVCLGDYVDRGPDSAGVVEFLLHVSKQAGIEVTCLAGNHEDLMIKALSSPNAQPFENWMAAGGDATLESYQRSDRYGLLHQHVDWLRTLPNISIDHAARQIFVHAGVLPDEFPQANGETCMWTRSTKFLNVANWKGSRLEGWTVVHGHTPVPRNDPEVHSGAGTRVNVDTGAVFGGRLSAAILTQEGMQGFLQA